MTQGKSENQHDPAAEIVADVLSVAGVDASEDAVAGETVVASREENHADNRMVIPRGKSAEVDDRTIVKRLGAEFDDRTVVTSPNEQTPGDHTVVVNRPLTGDEVDDHTIVANQPENVGDATVVVAAPAPDSGRPSKRDRGSLRRGEGYAQPPSASNPAPPVEEPENRGLLRRIIGGGLDPKRPIAQAPGSMPWEDQPSGERGLSQGLPVSYGARSQTEMPLHLGIDEVQRRVGPAPAPRHVDVVQGRELLPSLQRRDKKRALVTLVVYAGVAAACVFGLWGVAAIAFGW